MSFIMHEDDIVTVKVVVSGPGGVGKTTLLTRFTTNLYVPAKSTVGVNFIVHDEPLGDGVLRISYWDYAGEDRFKVLFPGYCTGSSGAFVVFDTSRPETLKEISDWINIIRSKNDAEIPIILIGTKVDAISKEDREYINTISRKYMNDNNLASYYLCSSKTGEGVREPFIRLAELLIKRLKNG